MTELSEMSGLVFEQLLEPSGPVSQDLSIDTSGAIEDVADRGQEHLLLVLPVAIENVLSNSGALCQLRGGRPPITELREGISRAG